MPLVGEAGGSRALQQACFWRGISAKEKTMALELIKTRQGKDTVGDLYKQIESVIGPYSFGGALAVLSALKENIVAEILPFHCGAMLYNGFEWPGGRSAVILLNERLCHADYRQAVEATMTDRRIIATARRCGYDMSRVLLLYIALATEYGHIDAYDGAPFAITFDWLKSYAGRTMWIQTFTQIERLTEECGAQQPVTCEGAKAS